MEFKNIVMTKNEIKYEVFNMLHDLTYQKLEGNFKSNIESEKQDEQCELITDILAELLGESLNFHLKAYHDGIINAEDCVQAIDEICNGKKELI